MTAIQLIRVFLKQYCLLGSPAPFAVNITWQRQVLSGCNPPTDPTTQSPTIVIHSRVHWEDAVKAIEFMLHFEYPPRVVLVETATHTYTHTNTRTHTHTNIHTHTHTHTQAQAAQRSNTAAKPAALYRHIDMAHIIPSATFYLRYMEVRTYINTYI